MPYTVTAKFSGIGGLVGYSSEIPPQRVLLCSDIGSGAEAVVEVAPQRVEPQVWLTASHVDAFNAYEPAQLTAVLTKAQEDDGDPYWVVSSVAVSAEGTGYQVGGSVLITGGGAIQLPDSEFSAAVSGITPEGGVATVNVSSGGKFYATGSAEIRDVKLISGGCGYSVYGRSAPTLTPVAFGGDGKAELAVTLKDFTDCDGLTEWVVSSITVSEGSGYDSITPVSFRIGEDDTCDISASAYIYTDPHTEPSLSLVPPSGGTGAQLSATIGPTAWGVESVDVSNMATPCNHGRRILFGYTTVGGGVIGLPRAHLAAGSLAPEITPLIFGPPPRDLFNVLSGCESADVLSGSTISATASQHSFDDGAPYYTVDSLTVSDGGQGIFIKPKLVTEEDGSGVIGVVASTDLETGAITAVLPCGGTRFESAALVSSVLVTDRGMIFIGDDASPAEPSLEAKAEYVPPNLCECELSVSTTPTAWGIRSVAVNSGGTGYTHGQELSVQHSADTKYHQTFAGTVRTVIEPPTAVALVASQNGNGALLTIPFTKSGDWYQAGIASIKSSGSGYSVGDAVSYQLTSGSSDPSQPVVSSLTVASVTQAGGIQAVSGGVGGRARKDTGVIESVSISQCGRYYNYTGTPAGVYVEKRGSYYKIDKNATPATAHIVAVSPGGNPQPVISATVDSDKSSESFGQVIDVSVLKKGLASYFAGGFSEDSGFDSLNGRSVVLHAANPVRLVHVGVASNFGDGACIEVNTSPEGVDYDGTPTGIKAISVTGGGSGYAWHGRVQPTLYPVGASGDDAIAWEYQWAPANTLTLSLKENEDEFGRKYWSIDDVDVQSASNEPAGTVVITFSGHVQLGQASQHVPASVTISRSEVGYPATVTIANSGVYYEESYDEPAYEADATVMLIQPQCASGSGAEFDVVINTDPYDYDGFGTVTGVTVTNQGSGYALLGGSNDCTYTNACPGVYPLITFTAGKKSSEVRITATQESLTDIEYELVFRSDQHTSDCYATKIDADAVFGGTGKAEIVGGGKWISGGCGLLNQSAMSATASVTVTTQSGECGNIFVGGEPCVSGDFTVSDICLAYAGNVDNSTCSTKLLYGSGVAENPPEYPSNGCVICPQVSVSVNCSGDNVKAIVVATSPCVYCTPADYDPASGNFGSCYDKHKMVLVAEHEIAVVNGAPQSTQWTQEFSLISPVNEGDDPPKFAVNTTITFGGNCDDENPFP